MTWSVSSPSVAGRDGVPTGFAEVAQPVQISQIQQGLIGSKSNLPDVKINVQMQKNIMDRGWIPHYIRKINWKTA